MKKLFDFKCDEHGRFEGMARSNEETKACPECGKECPTVISPVRTWLDGTDPDFPTAWDRWAKDHEEKAREANRKAQED